MAEVDIETRVVDRALNELGVRSIKLNLRGNTGWPDRLFFIPGGRPLLIEFKDLGEDPEPRQGLIGQFLEYNKYDYAVHDDAEAAFNAVKQHLESAITAGWRPRPHRGNHRPR